MYSCRDGTWWAIACIGLTISASADAVLDLPTAIQLALLQNRALQQAALHAQSAVYGIQRAEADFAYRWRPDGNAFFSDAGAAQTYGVRVARKLAGGTDVSLRGSTAGRDQDEAEASHRTVIRLQVSQPLFRSAGSLVQREPVVRAEREEASARRSLEQHKANIVVDVVRAYEDLVRLDRQIRFDEHFFDRVDRLYALTRARESQGRATHIDTLRVELQRGQALSRLESNRERHAARRLDFADLLGVAPGARFTLQPPPLVELDLPEAAEAHAVAFSNRLDLAQAQQDVQDAGRGVRIARRGLWPSLRLISRVEQFGEDDSFPGSTDLDGTAWSFGLQADSDYVPRRHRAALEQRLIDEETARRQLAILRDTVVRETDQGLLAYRRTHRELEMAEHNVSLAGDRVRLTRRFFELGRGDNFSVTDAEEAFLSAQQQLLLARAGASLAGYRLLQVLGTLVESPDVLKPGGEYGP